MKKQILKFLILLIITTFAQVGWSQCNWITLRGDLTLKPELSTYFHSFPEADKAKRLNGWRVLGGDGSQSYQGYRTNIENLKKVDDYLKYNYDPNTISTKVASLSDEFIQAANKLDFLADFIGGPLRKSELEQLNRLRNIQGNNYPSPLNTEQLQQLNALVNAKGNYSYPKYISPNIEQLQVTLTNHLSNDPQKEPLEKYFKADFKIKNNKIVGLSYGDYEYVILKNGELRIGKGHAHLSGNVMELKAAGRINIYTDGSILDITAQSGHYQPTTEQLNLIKTYFQSIGLL